MKKIQKLLIISLAILLANFANALEIVDVQNNHWAGQEIINSIQNGYIQVVDGNKFKPDSIMTRSEFVTSLLKVIRRQNEVIVQRTSFKDVSNLTPNNKSVVLSEQIRMAFGYPDKTFKPNKAIDHNETMSMIANITKGDYIVSDITQFSDYKKIPVWAKRAYIKNVANGFYVNHPNELQFNPTNNLTRAEAAVLFNRIAANLDKIQDKYRDLDGNGYSYHQAEFISEDSLSTSPYATNTKVQIYDTKKIIEAGNILIGTNLDTVKSRKDVPAQEYIFSAPNDVYTSQGAFLFPKGTEFYARVENLGYSAWRSKPERSSIVFHKYSLPNGETYDMAAVPFTQNDNIIYVNNVSKAKKARKTRAKAKQKDDLLSAAHQMMPLLDYRIKKDKTIYILLTGDMVIPQSEDYINFRTKRSVLEEDI